jgi:hypothetical protein
MTSIVTYYLEELVVWCLKKLSSYIKKNPGNLSRIFFGVALSIVITVITEFQLRTNILPKTSKESLDNLFHELELANFFEIFFFAFAIGLLILSFLNMIQSKNKMILVFLAIIILGLMDFISMMTTVRTGRMNVFTVSLMFLSLLLIIYVGYQFIIFLRNWVQDEENGQVKLNVPKITFLWTVLFALIGLLIKKS